MDPRQVALNKAFHMLNKAMRLLKKQYETREPMSDKTMESLLLLLQFLEDNTMEE
jgi:hypothetical protein